MRDEWAQRWVEAISQGWQAQELVCRTASRGYEDEDGLDDMTGKTGHIVVEAKMTNSLDSILRYRAAIKRDSGVYDPSLDTLLDSLHRGVREPELARAMSLTFHFRVARLFGKIDEAFCGEPFLEKSPDAPENQRRFNAYVAYLRRAGRLLEQAVELGRLVSSLKEEGATSVSQREKDG
jgi:hypothetical protein